MLSLHNAETLRRADQQLGVVYAPEARRSVK
jgi:hypothetical protein